jgi:cell division protease FtsH
MDETLGCVAYAAPPPRFLVLPDMPTLAGTMASPETARRIDEAVRAIVASAFDRATEVLRERRAMLDRCAAALLERETLDEEEIRQLMAEPSTPA